MSLLISIIIEDLGSLYYLFRHYLYRPVRRLAIGRERRWQEDETERVAELALCQAIAAVWMRTPPCPSDIRAFITGRR